MQDAKLIQENDTTFDMIIDEENKIYETVDGFETAYDFQLFVDQRTTKQDIANARYRQGWMADIMTKQEGYEVGSKIYLKRQSRNRQVDYNEIREFSKNALEYFRSIGAARNIQAEVVGNSIAGVIEVDINNVNRYTSLWQSTELD